MPPSTGSRGSRTLLLPVPYFLVTFTLPSGLRDARHGTNARSTTLLFRASAAALQQLARDPRFLGGQIGMLGVLQTWTRDLRYHPHVHYLVPGGRAGDGWAELGGEQGRVLVHVKPLARLFRAKLRAALRQTDLYAEIEPRGLGAGRGWWIVAAWAAGEPR